VVRLLARCSWISVRPRSAADMSPLTVLTIPGTRTSVVIACLSRGALLELREGAVERLKGAVHVLVGMCRGEHQVAATRDPDATREQHRHEPSERRPVGPGRTRVVECLGQRVERDVE